MDANGTRGLLRALGLCSGALALLVSGGCVDSPIDDGASKADRERSTTERKSAITGPEVDPIFVSGNTTCGDLFDDPDIIECKIEPVADGTYNNASGLPFTTNSDCDDLTVVLDVYQDGSGNNFFDWTSNLGIDGVFAKAQNGNFYWYTNPDDPDAPGEVTADDGLHAPANPSGKFPGLSHISFCWDPDPDLKVTKTASSGTINAGDTATFTIEVENHGNATAENVTLSDTLPTVTNGWTLGGADAASCSIVSNVLSCSFGDLAPGATRTITVSTTTTPAECTTLNNTVTVSADNEPDDLLSDNTDSDSITVQCPDIAVSKVAANDPINAGDDAVFDIVVTNNGAGTAYNVTLSDTLPSGTWTLSGTDAADCSIDGSNVLTCDFGDLANGESKSITLTRATTTDDCAGLSNTVTVDADNESDDVDITDDNTDTDTITVDCPDVVVDKSAVVTPVTIPYGDVDGEEVAFQIVVTNNGPGDAYDVYLTDTLPGTGWAVSGDDAADCSITVATNDLLTCDFGTIDEGDTRTIVVTRTAYRPDDCPDLSNTVYVSASNEDPADTEVACPVGHTPEYCNDDSADIVIECPIPPVQEDEGCTPGYWKQEHHLDSWVGYSPFQTLESVFDVPDVYGLDNVTLWQALESGDGMTLVQQLLRHAVAALLNASSPDVDYPYTEAQIIAAVNAALASGDLEVIENLKDDLEAANETFCPLD